MPQKVRAIVFMKRYLAFLTLIISISVVISATYLYNSYEKIIRTEKENELRAISDLKITQIVEWKTERAADVKYFSQSRLVWLEFEKWINNKSDKPSLQNIKERLRLTKENHNYVDMQILSLKGEVLFSFNDEKKLEVNMNSFLRQSIETKQIIFSDLYLCKEHNAVHFDILSPLINDKNEVFAVILSRINPYDYLFPLIKRWPTPSNSAETVLLRKDGEYALYLTNLRHKDSTALTYKMPLSQKDLPGVQAVLGFEGSFDGKDYRGIEVLADLRKIPNTNWYMVTKVDKEEMFKELKFVSTIKSIFVIVVILMVVIGISLLYNYRQKRIYKELYVTEKKFYNTQEEFKTTLYSIGDAVITTDLNGRVIHMNPVAENITGWKENNALGKPLLEVLNIVNELTHKAVESPVEKVLNEGKTVGLSNHTLLISKNGKETPIADSGAPIKNEDGKITGVVLVFRDQTKERANRRAIEESEMKYRNIFNSTNEGIALHEIVFDKSVVPINYRILDVNRRYEEITGLKREEVIGKKATEVYQSDIAPYLELFSKVAITGKPENIETYYEPMQKHFEISVYSPEKGKFATVFQDITKRKRVQKVQEVQYNIVNAVVNSGNLYELFSTVSKELNNLFDTTNFFVALYDEKTDMLYTPFEQGIEVSIDKWKAEKSLTGIVVKEKKSFLLNKEEIKNLKDEGKIEYIGMRAESWLGVPLKVGKKVLGAIVIQNFTKINAYDENSIDLMEVIAHELSIFIDHKKAEEVAQRLSKGIEQSPVCIVVTDIDGNIEYTNPKFSELTGYTFDEVIGINPRILKSDEHSKEFYKNLWDTVKSGNDWHGELLNKKKNGELYWESAIISPIFDEEKKITHFIAIKEDITEKKNMIDELITAKDKAEELNRLKSSFLSNVSHELRTPLNGILGFAALLKEELIDGESKKMAQIILRSGNRLHNTLNQILDLSTLQSKVTKVMRENIDVNKIVEESFQWHKLEAFKKNLELKFVSADKEIILFTDKNILLNTLNNLIDNALKYTHEGSVIIKLFEEGENVVIEVIDTGIGIEEKDQRLIFDEFRQVSEGYGRSFEGIGLGLSLCNNYMKLLGGSIKLNSELYRGSTFRIELPKVPGESGLIPKNSAKMDNDKPITTNIARKKYDEKILYFENDVDNQSLVEVMFKEYVQIDIAEDAMKGIKMANENDYAIILMDINLGSSMNGKDVTRLLRKDPRYKDIPIVAVSAFAMEGDKEEFIESGCTHYLSKPFEVEEMHNLIFSLLERK